MPSLFQNNKAPISLERVEWFCQFFDTVIWILFAGHGSYKNMLFWVGIVWHRLLAFILSDVLNLKKLKKIYEVSSWFFGSIEAIMLFWGMTPKCSWQISLQDFFTFDFFWLANLNTRGLLLHCTCYYVD